MLELLQINKDNKGNYQLLLDRKWVSHRFQKWSQWESALGLLVGLYDTYNADDWEEWDGQGKILPRSQVEKFAKECGLLDADHDQLLAILESLRYVPNTPTVLFDDINPLIGDKDPTRVALEWHFEGFSADEVRRWGAVQGWNPADCRIMADNNISPESVGEIVNGRTMAYWFCNGDLEIDELQERVLRTKQDPQPKRLSISINSGCLGEHLACWGLFRVLSQQLDSNISSFWRGDTFIIEGVDRQEASEFLLHKYKPTPIFSPWNSGEGLYPKDKENALQNSQTSRLSDYRESFNAALRIVQKLKLTNPPKEEQKYQLCLRLQNALPSLDWFKAMVHISVNQERLFYAPISITGGNDGNFGLARTFAKCLENVMDLDSGSPKPSSRYWLNGFFGDILPGMPKTKPLIKTMGFLFPNPMHQATNPWLFILAMEGICTLQTTGYDFISRTPFVPFPLQYFQWGTVDKGTGEVIIPTWLTPMSHQEFEHWVIERNSDLDLSDGFDALVNIYQESNKTIYHRFSILDRNGRSHYAVFSSPQGEDGGIIPNLLRSNH